MARFGTVVEAFIASRELDKASLSRLAFWVETLGNKEVAAITVDDIDLALVQLAERGRLKGGKHSTTATRQAHRRLHVPGYFMVARSVPWTTALDSP